MYQLVFRERNKGSVVLNLLKGAPPGLSATHPSPKFEVRGIPLSPAESYSPNQAFFSTYQQYQFLFELGETPQLPPFTFSLAGKPGIALVTKALNDRVFMASWESQQWIGELEFQLKNGSGETIWALQAEIIPPHLPYRQEQAFMFGELEAWIRGLGRAIEKPLLNKVGDSLPWYQKDLGYGQLEAEKVDEFLKQLDMLELQLEKGWQFGGKWESSQRSSGKAGQAGFHIREGGKSWIRSKSRDVHTPLNQWLQQVLIRLLSRAEATQAYPDLQRNISFFLRRNFALSPPPAVLHQPTYLPPAYQRWYRAYLDLFRRLSLHRLPVFQLGLKDLPQLYEYWCFLKLASLLGSLSGAILRQQDLLFFDQGQGVSRLAHGQQLRFSYESADGRSEINLWYQREGKTEVGSHKPDIWLEIRKEGTQTAFTYLFDVKFQLDRRGRNPGFQAPKKALNQLHRYRDALISGLRQDEKGRYAQKALGGAVLFPYPLEEQTFSSHPQYRQLWEKGIGAIPLQPRPYAGHELLRSWLSEILDAPSEALFERMLNYDKSELDLSLERFDQVIEITNSEHWDEKKREWEGKKLFGEGPMPKQSKLAALDAALRYRQLHLLWIQQYLELRLWQELIRHCPDSTWTSQGLSFRLQGKAWTLVLKGEKVEVSTEEKRFALDRSPAAEIIVDQVLRHIQGSDSGPG